MSIPLPPLNLNLNQKADSKASQVVDMGSGAWGLSSGDWVINIPTSGSGLTLQGGASSGLGGLGLVAVIGAAGLAWLMLRRKGR